ncbi:protein NLRC3-like [Poecilia formosa]|uniref:protein NLRC3-like n=1 Tax=Poecilia formosa TaxID=48698 RepID=UPI0007B87E81|nr:PREDICTED: protein NLRC3-like [Poecilia formosa]
MIDTNNQHEEKLVKTYNDMFTDLKKKTVRTVLTKGIAGIGKTFQAKLFMFDWAKGKSNKDVDIIVPLQFSELKTQKEAQSLDSLLKGFFHDEAKPGVSIYEKKKVAFVLDGLENYDLPLDFDNNIELTDIKTAASMDVILTNLIKGNLLPKALLWIISQPSGVHKIPGGYIEQVTECRESLMRRKNLVSSLKRRFIQEYPDGGEDEVNHPNQKTTEHIMRNVPVDDMNDDATSENTASKSLIKLSAPSDVFKNGEQKIRTVLTVGEPDIGKSFHVQKLVTTWAKNETQHSIFTWDKDQVRPLQGKAEDNLEVIFPLDLSKIDLIKGKRISFLELLSYLFVEIKEFVVSNYTRFEFVFVLDGLNACQHLLHFDNNETVTDVREQASVDVLITSLIKGNLLPTARVWITSRPSAAEQLPDEYVDRKTEIREKPDFASQRKLKAQLKEYFTYVSEGIDQEKTSALLKDIYTDLYIIEGDRGEVNAQHELRQVQDAKFKQEQEETLIRYCDIFKPSPLNTNIKTVLTIGVAGIGKTFASMKYILDWAEGTASENIFFTFPLPFRELNLRKEEEHSFEGLIHQLYPAMKTSEITDYDKYEILIVLDGLDECRLDLEFNESHYWTDVKKQGSVSVMLSNLIQGNLLPNAQIWITSRPAASNNIPAEKIDRTTEVRGFNDEQKEEHFRKKFSDTELAENILRHVKQSRSLFIMCHVPVFCWITSKVLEDIVHRNQDDGLPKTLTDIYTHFVLLQCRQANVKYTEQDKCESSESYSCWNTRNKETVLALGKLAFEAIEDGDLLFNEENLIDSGIDVINAAVFSGLFTQIKREDHGLYQQKLFCFVHVTIQEYLAALYVFHTFSTTGINLFSESTSRTSSMPASEFYKKAVDKALESKNGDWDLFLRFLLGLSLETNQVLLQELLKKTENYEKTYKETVKYIKKKIREDVSDPEKNLNLFHCLNELNDNSLVQEIKKFLQSDTRAFENFTTSQWSALTYVLLTSEEKLDVFDLKKYMKSEKVLLGMLPVVKVSRTALLSWCELSEMSCSGLTSSVLSSASSNLTELDLSHNDLLDSGVQLLAEGLRSLHCKLEVLQLQGCQVTEKGCDFLASALKSNKVSKLRELDLSYNHCGDYGMSVFNTIAEDPTRKLETVCFDYNGPHRLKLGMMKYAVDLKLDERTAGRRLLLSENNKEAKTILSTSNRVSQPENEGRFKRTQVLCEESLKCICYWEVEWTGKVGIAVAYKTVGRERDSSGGLGCNDWSWSLLCSKTECIALHGTDRLNVRITPCQKIGVLLDWKVGTLSYFNVSSGGLSLIHTFYAKFTKELFAGFWFQKGSITLCEI